MVSVINSAAIDLPADDGAEFSSERIVTVARAAIDSHPHFRGRSRWVNVGCPGHKLHLTGRLPNFYLKQLAQEAVRDIDGVEEVVNEIVVASPTGETHKNQT